MNFEALGQVLANYFDFFIAFATHPSRTLKRLERSANVDPAIAQHFLVGIAIAVGLGLASGSPTPAPAPADASVTEAALAAFARADPAARPLLAVAAIFAFAVLAHLTVRLVEAVVRFTTGGLDASTSSDAATGGPVHATVNAVMALSACYVPAFMLVIAALAVLVPPLEVPGLSWVFLVVLFALVAALYAYLLLALSATHGIPAFTMLVALFLFVLPFSLVSQDRLWLVPVALLITLAAFRRWRRRRAARRTQVVISPGPTSVVSGEGRGTP